MTSFRIDTDRLELLAPDAAVTRLAGGDVRALRDRLGAEIPGEWPPELTRDGVFERVADELERHPELRGWSLWFILLRRPRVLIGTAGYKGLPRDGRVDIGYGVLDPFQRRGYATEASQAMIIRAFDDPRVDRIVAETLEGLNASIRVMEKCGFRFAGRTVGHEGEPEVLQYELSRRMHEDRVRAASTGAAGAETARP